MNKEEKAPIFIWMLREDKEAFHRACFNIGYTMTEVLTKCAIVYSIRSNLSEFMEEK